ncbi:hypothetical protein F4821DRAFT_257028 [Hypoxylon rubiginosum]|uniref:Uncharacterized protein n=1 Tax=Hypoxylon rubiginosum TaxID=110542 RepID=A0ACC0D945_9PEZI|nr:hypothetical protein F4821DRAFT_257028 [Hypoxylon rubiginosum]
MAGCEDDEEGEDDEGDEDDEEDGGDEEDGSDEDSSNCASESVSFGLVYPVYCSTCGRIVSMGHHFVKGRSSPSFSTFRARVWRDLLREFLDLIAKLVAKFVEGDQVSLFDPPLTFPNYRGLIWMACVDFSDASGLGMRNASTTRGIRLGKVHNSR